MQIHHIRPGIKRKAARRVGRGGKRGTYSGRGVKGQKARAGRRIRPQLRDVLKKLPKRRGYRVKLRPKRIAAVSIQKIEKNFERGAIVSPQTLIARGLVEKISGKVPHVKIIGDGELAKPLLIKNCLVSKNVKEMLRKVGGQIQV